jgi:hypothetical protein
MTATMRAVVLDPRPTRAHFGCMSRLSLNRTL